MVIGFEKQGKSRMVESERAAEKLLSEVNDRKVVGEKLVTLSLAYLVLQLLVDWTANYFFSSNLGISRFIYSIFVGIDSITPALARLKVLYRGPIDGREFSEVFAIYFSLLTLLGIYLIALGGLLFSRRLQILRWSRMVPRDYAMLSLCCALGVWGIYFFCVGPPTSLRNYRGMFGTDFIGSVCLVLPLAQFLILFILALYYAIGGNSREKS